MTDAAMPDVTDLVVCYEIYLMRSGSNRMIFLTRVRDATAALLIADYQVQVLNESWNRRVKWTSHVVESLCTEAALEGEEAEPKQGDTADVSRLQPATQ